MILLSFFNFDVPNQTEIVCEHNGEIPKALKRWEARSAMALLLCIKRTTAPNVAGRMNDVLREVLDLFTRFNVLYDEDW